MSTEIINKWYNSSLYQWDKNDKDRSKIYSIDTPPPTVSGALHMGHVFSYSQADFIARYKRMKGYNVFYPIGFDDNGLPTERLVEKIKEYKAVNKVREGKKDEFLKDCKEVVETAEKDFEHLFKSLGLSFDWTQKYQTISDESIAVAHASFNDLCEKRLAYQANAPVYWCTVDRTALAQADIEDKEKDSEEVTFKCKIDGEEFYIDNETGEKKPYTIMTTRPELIPACVMVLYHPDDTRFKPGMMVKMPFIKDPVPLLKDSHVKMDKGTGLVMCCTYGDWQDVEWVREHVELPKPIISKSGRISKEFYDSIDGINYGTYKFINEFFLDEKILDESNSFTIKEARKYAVELLGDLVVSKKHIKHIVKCAERSGAPVEIVEAMQWYIHFGLASSYPISATKVVIEDLMNRPFKSDLLKIINHIDFHPSHLKQRLIDWINGLNQDWCISRDRFSGVPIVADGKDTGQVFDTWFTSSVSPQLNTKTINVENITGKSEEDKKKNLKNHQALFPFDLRPQAHEIIRTWAFYTIVKAYMHALEWDDESRPDYLSARVGTFILKNKNGQRIDLNNTTQEELFEAGVIPWKNVMLSGWCLASDKSKMSKSKGNVVEPLPLIEKETADVVRYWAACSSLGVDTYFNETKFRDGHRLIAKLGNVVKFLMPSLSIVDKSKTTKEAIDNNIIYEVSDLWILGLLKDVAKEYDECFDEYNYSGAKDRVERFFWDKFCDNYLEIIKSRMYGIEGYAYKSDRFKDIPAEEIDRKKISAATTAYYVLDSILKMLAPFIPFTADKLHNDLMGTEINESTSIHRRGCAFINKLDDIQIDRDIKEQGAFMLEIIDIVRKYKAEKKLSIKAPIGKMIINNECKIDGIDVKDCVDKLFKFDGFALDILSVVSALDASFLIENKGEVIISCE